MQELKRGSWRLCLALAQALLQGQPPSTPSRANAANDLAAACGARPLIANFEACFVGGPYFSFFVFGGGGWFYSKSDFQSEANR